MEPPEPNDQIGACRVVRPLGEGGVDDVSEGVCDKLEVHERASVARRLSYAVGDFSLCLAWNGASAFLIAVWMKVGIPMGAIGAIMFFGQLLTAVFDLIVGVACDAVRGRNVGYSLWIRRGAFPMALMLWAVFAVPDCLSGSIQITVAAVLYVLFLMVYSCCSVPYSSLLTTISLDQDSRTSFSAWRMTGAFLGAFAITTGFPLLTKSLSISLSVVLVATSLFVGLFASSCGVREKTNCRTIGRRVDGMRGFLPVIRNKSFLRLFAVAVLFCAGNSARFGALALFVAETTSSAALCSSGFACLTLASACGASLVPCLSRRFGLFRLFGCAAILSSVASGAYFALAGCSQNALFAFLVLVELCSGMMPSICNVLVSSFADRHGGDVAGRIFAIWGLTGKLGNGLGALAIALSIAACPGRTGALVALAVVPAFLMAVLFFLLPKGRVHV